MRKFVMLILSLSFIFSGTLTGQSFKMGQSFEGRQYGTQTLGRNNILQLQNANIHLQQFDEQEAFFAYENAVAQNPYSANALLRRANFKKLIGMEAEAELDAKLATRLNPYAADLYGYNGPFSILNLLSIQPEQALRGLSKDQKMTYYYNWLDQEFIKDDLAIRELSIIEEAVYMLELDKAEMASVLIDSLITINPSLAISYDLKGLMLIDDLQYEEARTYLAKAVAIQPDYAIAWYNFSQAETGLKNYRRALEYLDRAIQLNSEMTKAYFDRALLYKKLGEKERAIEDYNQVLKIQGKSFYSQALLNRGLTKKMAGDFEGALADLNHIIEEYPDNAELYKNRGNLYLLFNYHNLALADYTKAIQLDPNFAEAYYNRGLTHLILLDNYSGCQDLKESATLGYERANEKIAFFCVE